MQIGAKQSGRARRPLASQLHWVTLVTLGHSSTPNALEFSVANHDAARQFSFRLPPTLVERVEHCAEEIRASGLWLYASRRRPTSLESRSRHNALQARASPRRQIEEDATEEKSSVMSVLRKILQEQRDQIVQRFVSEVERTEVAPGGTRRSLLVDHIPRFLDRAPQQKLEGPRDVRVSDAVNDTSPTARKHGEQRWQLGYDLDGLVREDGILRECILSATKQIESNLRIGDVEVFANFMSVGVAQAVTEYIKHRDAESDGQRANLKFLEEAGQLLSSSLDYRSTLD